jgi:hypothetical protein
MSEAFGLVAPACEAPASPTAFIPALSGTATDSYHFLLCPCAMTTTVLILLNWVFRFVL